MSKKTSIYRELLTNEYLETREQLEIEKYQLAEWMHDECGLLFQTAMQYIEDECRRILPGYRGGEKLLAFRKEIRDEIKAGLEEVLQRLDDKDHTDTDEEHRRMMR